MNNALKRKLNLLLNILIPISFGILFAMENSCSFSGFGTEEVVERSKETKPEWAKKSGFFQQDDQLITIYQQSNLPDLPLGAKDVQLAAFSASQQNIEQKLSTEAAPPATTSDENKATINEFHGKFAGISDIYYEKYIDKTTDEAQERYRVYVRVFFSTVHYQELLAKLLNPKAR